MLADFLIDQPSLDRRGIAPPIIAASPTSNYRPVRLHRTRKARASCPAGAIYVGRPTLWGNPFTGRRRIGHARSVILFQAWIAGNASPHVLASAGLSEAEVSTLRRRRDQLLANLSALRGRDLQCWCPLTSAWCHAEVLLRVANT